MSSSQAKVAVQPINKTLSLYDKSKTHVIEYGEALSFFSTNCMEIMNKSLKNLEETQKLINITSTIPKYGAREISERLKALYLTSNTFGKPIEMIEYYLQGLIIYPAKSLDKLFNKKFKDFPSLYEMHELLVSISTLEYFIYRLNFNEYFNIK